METINPRLNSATGGMTYTAAVVVYLVVTMIISLILQNVNLDAHSDGYIYLSYLIAPVAIGASVAGVLGVRKINFKQVFPVKCHPKYYLIGLMMIFGLLFSLSWINGVSVEFFKLFGYKPRESASYFPRLDGGYIVLALLVIAVIPAFVEELLFRGVILNSCENGMGSIRAVLTVGFAFSLFHASPEQTVYQFIAGCAFAFLAVRSHSILPPIMMHFINNALIIIFGACGLYDEAGNLIISSGANIALITVSAVSLIGAVVWLVLDKTYLKKYEKGGVKNFFLFASIGIAAMGLLWIFSLFGIS